ncbi:DUF1904 domain-containing protein [Paenibacillus sp. HWE-109]|uniref:DUF1904 family protein n=1 Tax=Paenibacillus sp. HWE-109 TaxID=1306526 RepID=UPI001EDD0B34|nr:DUF1904 family protein [Paenibacillus sp. HWE-109]UKS25964.1 DUF1904 domain-containing protein [Paenibacillus sp. HWE-109]
MPQLIFRGIPAEGIRAISIPLVEEMATICQCGTDNFTLECLHVTAIFDGKYTDSYPFIDVWWFERGDEVRDKMAEAIDKYVRSLGIPDLEISFRVGREDNFYMNGRRYNS